MFGINKNGQESELEQTMKEALQKNEELQEKLNQLEESNKRLKTELDDVRKKNEELQLDISQLKEKSGHYQSEQVISQAQTEENFVSVPQEEIVSTGKAGEKEEMELEEQQPLGEDAMDKISSLCQNILDKIGHLERSVVEELQSSINILGVKDDNIHEKDVKLQEFRDKYERLLQNVQEDRYRKDKSKLINKLISYVDLMRRVLYDYDAKREGMDPMTEDAIFFRQQIESLILSMDDALKHEMVNTLPMASPGDDVDEERMEVIDTVETDDPALDGKIFRSVSACYTWSLPYILKARINETGDEVRTYNFVLHPEEVITYKLKK